MGQATRLTAFQPHSLLQFGNLGWDCDSRNHSQNCGKFSSSLCNFIKNESTIGMLVLSESWGKDQQWNYLQWKCLHTFRAFKSGIFERNQAFSYGEKRNIMSS